MFPSVPRLLSRIYDKVRVTNTKRHQNRNTTSSLTKMFPVGENKLVEGRGRFRLLCHREQNK